MWELIQANKRKSVFLFSGLFFVLAILGFIIGGAVEPGNGPYVGLLLAVVIAVFMGSVSYFAGDSIILAMAGATRVSHDIHPQLFNVVEEMKIAANFPVMPKVYIIPDTAPNAFATGKKPEDASIVVTAGLLSRLNRDELQGVVAHEMSHILNRDVLFMTMAGVMLGSIVFLSEVFLRSLWYSGGGRRFTGGRRGGKGSGQAQLVFLLLSIAFAILGPIVAQLLYFAISRKREYLADASAARLTRYPEGLASALEKISSSMFSYGDSTKKTSKVLAPMYIINPLHEKKLSLSSWTSTHPPTPFRIRILRSMMGGASYNDYQSAYEKMSGEKPGLIPSSELHRKESVSIRQPTAEKEPESRKKATFREAGDIIRAMSRFAFILCACGLKMKIPPDYKKSSISCPRCGRTNQIPRAQMAAMAAALGATEAVSGQEKTGLQKEQVLRYRRKTDGWETFACACGGNIQLSPLFKARFAYCPKCHAKIEIETAA
ncbi:MAG: M48 family metalloprotease [Candidatus Aureabacteria bacterium]|nr:M48 family metalloprotease [Candidatus Auribacterota bacterium]